MATSRNDNRVEKKGANSDRLIPQLTILKKMSEGAVDAHSVRQFQIHELAAVLGGDEGEAQRSLFILEGHKFVTPQPEGDFTSKIWQITEGGLQVAKSLAKTTKFGQLKIVANG